MDVPEREVVHEETDFEEPVHGADVHKGDLSTLPIPAELLTDRELKAWRRELRERESRRRPVGFTEWP